MTTSQTAEPGYEVEPPPVPTTPASPPLLPRVLHILERYALAILLVAVLLFFSIWPKTSPAYTQLDSFRNILGSQIILAILALGAIVPLICGQFDLSIGAIALLSSVLSASAYANWHLPLVGVRPTV